MPKFLVTSGSYFQPFTYDELAKPVMQAVEAHNAAQDQYDTLSDQTELLRRYVEQEPENAIVRKRYNEYLDRLTTLQNNLWKNGFNAGTRRDLSAARAGFNSDITRIGNAIKTRQERSAEFNKYRHEHPDAVTSSDPGLASLDEYYNNDMYGQDYYTYSGNQFSAEVAADMKARASELLRNPEVLKDPMLVGYLTRIEKEGLTNAEAQNAIAAVKYLVSLYRDNLAALNDIDETTVFSQLDGPTQMAATVLLSHLKSTGAAGRVSAPEFDRLVNYGSFGVSSSVGDTKTQVLSDKQYDRQTSLMSARASRPRTTTTTSPEQPERARRDRYVRNAEGANYGETYRRYKNEFGEDELIAGKDGSSVGSKAEAAFRVYSNKERIDFYKESGIDVGRDIRHQRGEMTIDGKTYEVRYNRLTDSIVYREKGSNKRPVESEYLTERYHAVRDIYDETIDYYKKNAPEIYNAAKDLDPEKQWRIYERDEVPFDVPITNYKDELFSRPGNEAQVTVPETYIARRGVDSGKYIDRFAGLMYGSLDKDKDGKVTNFNGGDVHNGVYSGIHEINRDGSLQYDAVKDPNTVFKIDEDNHKIVNIDDVRISLDALMNNYIIVKTYDSNKEYAIGLDLFRSEDLLSKYIKARRELSGARNDDDVDDIINELAGDVMDWIGYDINTVSEGGTKDKSEN